MISRFQFLLPPSLPFPSPLPRYRVIPSPKKQHFWLDSKPILVSFVFKPLPLSLYSSQNPKSLPLHHKLDTKEEAIHVHLHPCCRCASPLHSRCPRVPHPPLSNARPKKKRKTPSVSPGSGNFSSVPLSHRERGSRLHPVSATRDYEGRVCVKRKQLRQRPSKIGPSLLTVWINTTRPPPLPLLAPVSSLFLNFLFPFFLFFSCLVIQNLTGTYLFLLPEISFSFPIF